MMKKIEESEELIIGLEAEEIVTMIGGEKKIMAVRVTTDNHGYGFVLRYSKASNIKLGDKIKVKKEFIQSR